ncbi:MAG: glycosyltransferase [Caldilineaceae bacterium]
MKYFKLLVRQILRRLLLLLTLLLCLVLPKRKKMLIWGPTPIISYQYWSEAMQQAGWESVTLMPVRPAVTSPTKEGLYFADLVPPWIKTSWLREDLSIPFAMLYIIQNASVLHMSYQGGPFGQTFLWQLEAYLFRYAKIKTVVTPFGGDAWMYSRVIDISVRHGLLQSFPWGVKEESSHVKRVDYWNKHADVVISMLMVDGLGRWDVPANSIFCIDIEAWRPKSTYSANDGKNGPVKVIHTPNFRGFKGTEFLLQAIKELQAEGLQIELVLLEKVANEKIRELMPQMDILVEQLLVGYALSGIEGMASGVAVLSNLDIEAYTRIFRRYGFLNECPILSTTPETIKTNLRALVTNPQLREQLGRAGRQYVEKYHSYEMAQYLFGAIYDKILYGKDIDLMNLFHPLKSEYNRKTPFVTHPLIENHLPKQFSGQNSEC